ncbi:hypothetical protein WJX74_004534 [Apatococcus lobatus]|uniref:Uncharacterized protein n=1 Tax=Apatococcus lobatus TaxID=904363 RepID=A0AAW1RAV6_9CHLO
MTSHHLLSDHLHRPAASSQQQSEQTAAVRAQQQPGFSRSAHLSESRGAQRSQKRAAAQSVVSPPGAGLLADNGLIQQRPQLPRLRAEPQQPMRVAVDVDEVLARFLPSLNRFVKERYNIVFALSDYSVYEFHRVWRCDRDTARNIVHEFFGSKHFIHGIRPIPGAFQSLQRLKQHCELVVVTSRQNAIQDATRAWLDQHYPQTFREVFFGNHFAKEGATRTKSDICREVGASVLVDDNPGYAVDCATAGLQVLLYDWQMSYPWNRPCPELDHPLIQRVGDWRQVEHALKQLSRAHQQKLQH